MNDPIEHPPLLHDADLMLAVLKTGDSSPAGLDDCIRHIHGNLQQARVKAHIGEDELRERLESALFHLEKARLVERRVGDTYETTPRGRRALREHPKGIDDTVLMEYPEFADFIHKLGRRAPPEDTRTLDYQQGYDAFLDGRNYTDNPFGDDSARHLAWENGWFQAFDDHGDIEHE